MTGTSCWRSRWSTSERRYIPAILKGFCYLSDSKVIIVNCYTCGGFFVLLSLAGAWTCCEQNSPNQLFCFSSPVQCSSFPHMFTSRCLSCVTTSPWKTSCCSSTPTPLRKVMGSQTPPRRKHPNAHFICSGYISMQLWCWIGIEKFWLNI